MGFARGSTHPTVSRASTPRFRHLPLDIPNILISLFLNRFARRANVPQLINTQISGIFAPSRTTRGAYRGRHGRWCGMRWTLAAFLTRTLLPPPLKLRRTCTQARRSLWRRRVRTAKSCDPDTPTLVSSWRRCFASRPATVARKPGHRGRARRKPLKPLRGESRMIPLEPVVTTLVCYFISHARLL